MGSSVSKSKKNRQSTSSLPSKKTRKTRPRSVSEVSIPQNPQQWSYETNINNNKNNVNDNITSTSAFVDDSRSTPFKKLTRNHQRTSGNNNSPNPDNTSQPRTSTSNGRPSFSLLRGRKSNQLQRGQNDYTDDDEPQRKPILHISAPIIEPSDTAEGGTLLPSFPDAPPPRHRPRPSVEVNRYQPNQYVEPSRSSSSGAYKAKVPALPISAQFATIASPSTTPLLSDIPSFPLPPTTISTPPLTSGSLLSQSPHLEDSQRLWRESLRNAAEGRKSESGLVRSNSNNSQSSSRLSYSSSIKGLKRNKPLSGSTFATSLSPSSSSVSLSSLPNRKRSGRVIEGDHEGSLDWRLARNKDFWRQSRSENSSVVSLPGSRYIGTGGSAFGDDDLGSSSILGKNPSEPSLSGSPHVTSGVISSCSPSLVGFNTLNNRYDNQFPNPRYPQYHSQPSSPQKRWSQAAGWGEGDGGVPLSPSRSRLHKSSARESMSSISTANYQWMDEQPQSSGDRDAVNRDSVTMLFDSPTSSQIGSFEKSIAPTLSPEQIAQQHLEQQAQQHALLKYFFKGNYRAPFDKQTLGSVLDVGCGVGLWMKDMALEFPLTEVHGVDLVVPTRRRRPRVNAPLATSSPTKSSFSDKTSDQHSSIQSASSAGSAHHSSSGYPYATPPSTSSPAMLDSMPSNCFFHKADITQCLPFADNTFDYCHIQLVLWGYQLNAFPNLLDEMIRVTKKDGWIEFVDMDPCLKKTTETGTRINEWIKTGLIHSNMDPDLVKTLPKFLKEYCEAIMPQEPKTPSVRDSDLLQVFGLDRLKISKVSLPFGPWGGKVGELWQQNFTSFLKELEPMMVDATLSGLIMDQYHRLCLDEMQQMAAEASRLSGSAGAGERITSFDHRICTHKAWMHLIHQLLTDASYSLPSTDANATKSSKTAPSSPSTNMSSSIKEMRSYNNFYLIHAQKVDLMELKQQILLQKLEQSILSPSLGETGATFTSQAPSLLSAIQQPANQEEPFSQQTSTLFDKLSLSGPKKPIIYPKDGQEVASLTEDALENFNKINGGTSRSIRDGSVSNVMTAGSFAPPAPTSVAALSIRSSSRMSNNNSTNGDIKNQNNLPGTPGSITSSGCHSPRAEATVARAMSYLRREGSVKSGLGSPQPQSQPQSASESEANNNSNNKGFVPDYFNQVPVNNPASYHQQQYNHHFQQQMNVIKRKPSLLNQVLAPSVEAQRNKDRAEKGVLEEEGDESNVAATEVQDAASERTSSSVAQTDDADSSVILISLEDEGVPDDESEETQMGVSGAITGHAQSDNDDNTIEIFNRISEDGEEKEEEEDNGELQMLVLDDEEVFVMLAPDSHRGSLQEGSAQQGVSTMDVMVPQEALEVRPVEESADEEELDTKVDPVSELASNAPATESTPTVPVAPEESSSAKRWSVDPEETEQDGDDGTSAAPSEIGDGDQDVEGGDVDEEKARSNGAHPAGSDATVADAHKAKSKKKSKAKKGRKH
ncbi:hypothetical protein BGZ59_010045 [Podila verticillata]|nr:hypothetical protein BGZ59_010045 [Podila verticillata]KFH72480.1 hypothetical protein MVEG_02771 [Podila verticillata NRRL 6337]